MFAVKPKKMVQGKRYFEGQIWVDDRDLQIVKTYGKGVGLLKKGSDNQFPKFETYREQIDGKYWFPTYTAANDTLHFQSGPQRIKMTVKYEDYKRFEGRSTIQFGDVVDEKAPTAAPPAAAEEIRGPSAYLISCLGMRTPQNPAPDPRAGGARRGAADPAARPAAGSRHSRL